ncbi:MAG: hypothetical protein JRJ69_07535 [Deltaproteobacteria bacterium]|nr:hypothetical protein [Deltaproteobacteria bacterium]
MKKCPPSALPGENRAGGGLKGESCFLILLRPLEECGKERSDEAFLGGGPDEG